MFFVEEKEEEDNMIPLIVWGLVWMGMGCGHFTRPQLKLALWTTHARIDTDTNMH